MFANTKNPRKECLQTYYYPFIVTTHLLLNHEKPPDDDAQNVAIVKS